jgi:hypothetical protein
VGTSSTDATSVTPVASVAEAAPAAAAETAAAPVAAAAPAPAQPVAEPAPAPAAAAAPAPAAPAAPNPQQMHPVGIEGGQVGFTPTQEQMKNARMIVQAGQAMGLPPRAWVIALATALQESHLNNYGNLGAANDHDSLGLFQQRPSSGWGSEAEVQNPTYSATAFYKGLKGVSNWDSRQLTDAAQSVQVSAYPDAYAKWEAMAGDLVQAMYFQGPLAQLGLSVS